MAHPRQFVQPFILSVILGVAVYAITALATDLQAVLQAAVRLGVSGWLAVLGLSLINYGLRFVRWQTYLGQLDHHIPIGRHIAYYLAGFAFTTTPGKAGEAVRCLYLKRHHVPYRHSLTAIFVERFIDTVAMVLLALVAAVAFKDARWPIVVLGSIIISLLPLIHSQKVQNVLEYLRTGVASHRFRSLLSHFQDLLRSSSTLLRSGSLYSGMVIGLLAWGAEGYGFFITLDYLGIHTSVMLAVGIYAVSVLIGAISFMPGGLGSTEAAMFLLLGFLGADTPTAVAATLICRAATLWFAVAIGLLVVGGLAINGKWAKKVESPSIEP